MSKTFKDFVMEDLDVFFNVDELAEEHELGGKTLPLVIVDNQSNNAITGFPSAQMYASQEVFKQFKTVYVKASDFHVPNIESTIILDGEEYYVEDAKEGSGGVIRMLLSLYES